MGTKIQMGEILKHLEYEQVWVYKNVPNHSCISSSIVIHTYRQKLVETD